MFHSKSVTTSLGLLASTAILFTASAADASSVSNPGLQFQPGARVSHSAPLDQMLNLDGTIETVTLDWRRPSIEMSFDLSESERTQALELVLSADPVGRVDPSTPILVQFNTGKPTPVITNGRGFEAVIPFKPQLSRPRRNIVRIIFPTPEGADCLAERHGQWSVDLKTSRLNIQSRTKRRAMELREVEQRLSRPAFAPKTVGLVASGPQATKLQALAAQGMGLRMDRLPRFTTSSKGNDFTVVAITRDKLSNYTNDAMILKSTGPRVFVAKGRPLELVFTADDDAQLVESLKAFSTHHLPAARRSVTSLGELSLQSDLSSDTPRVNGSAKLYELGTQGWGASAQSYRFSVADPAATSGELTLKLSSPDTVADTSRLRVALNGEVLGAALLDKSRKTVRFNIPQGRLHGSENVLSLLPEVRATDSASCATGLTTPDILIGDASKLTLSARTPSPVTELSRFAATAAPFSDAGATESYIALPRSKADYNAALGVLARLAKSHGGGLENAVYVRGGNIEASGDRHALFIGPSNEVTAALGADLRLDAPRSLMQALNGVAISGDNLMQAEIARFASTDGDFAVAMAAKRTAPTKLTRGGVAALYAHPDAPGRVVGVIASAPRTNFAQAARTIVAASHWNAIEGGVARWDDKTVLMAQMATPVKGYANADAPSFEMPKLDWDGLSLPEFNLPDVTLPDWNMPDWNMPEFDAPNVTAWFGGIKSRFAKADVIATAPAATVTIPEPRLAPRVTPPVVAAPIVTAPGVAAATVPSKPMFKPGLQANTGLRGSIQTDGPSVAKQKSAKPFDFTTWRLQSKSKLKDAGASFRQGWKEMTAKVTGGNLKQDIRELQRDMKPAGKPLRKRLKKWFSPATDTVAQGQRKISPIGMLMILILGAMLILVGLAKPSMVSHNNH